jgi:hypothetical protein
MTRERPLVRPAAAPVGTREPTRDELLEQMDVLTRRSWTAPAKALPGIVDAMHELVTSLQRLAERDREEEEPRRVRT